MYQILNTSTGMLQRVSLFSFFVLKEDSQLKLEVTISQGRNAAVWHLKVVIP
jgi:hypothetical protein